MSNTLTIVQQSVSALDARPAEAVEAAVEKALTSSAVTSAVTADIQNLAQTVKDIRQGFRTVADGLLSFDSSDYKDTNGTVLRLRPTWLAYQAVRFLLIPLDSY